ADRTNRRAPGEIHPWAHALSTVIDPDRRSKRIMCEQRDCAFDAMSHAALAGRPLPNVWLGVSVEDQRRADERVPDLLATAAAVRWLSCEPLLGAVNLNAIHEYFDGGMGHSWESCLNGKRFDPWS